jgi:hypothetical protein
MPNPLYIIAADQTLDQIQLQINGLESGGAEFIDSNVEMVKGTKVNLVEVQIIYLPTPVVLTQLVVSGSPKPSGITNLIKTCTMLVSGAPQSVDSYR